LVFARLFVLHNYKSLNLDHFNTAQTFLNIRAKYSEKEIKEVHDKTNVKNKISGLNYGGK